MYGKMVVAYDGSAAAKNALKTAIHLAKTLGSEFHVVTVMQKLPAYAAYATAADPALTVVLDVDRRRFYEDLQSAAKETAAREGIEAKLHLLDGDIVEAISSFIAAEKVDLLVAGIHRRTSRMSRIWSTLAAIAQNVPCSVLGVH